MGVLVTWCPKKNPYDSHSPKLVLKLITGLRYGLITPYRLTKEQCWTYPHCTEFVYPECWHFDNGSAFKIDDGPIDHVVPRVLYFTVHQKYILVDPSFMLRSLGLVVAQRILV